MRSTVCSPMPRLVTLFVTLLISEPMLGQQPNQGCRNPSPGNLQTHYTDHCSGTDPAEVRSMWAESQITATLSCKQNGWKQNSGINLGWWSQEGQAVCGYSPEGTEPDCQALFQLPWFSEEKDGGVVMSGLVDDAHWDVWRCRWDSAWTDLPQFFAMEGCCDSFCADESACNSIGEWYGAGCTCVLSPIVLDLDGNGIHLSSWEDGVQFDLACSGKPRPIAWPEHGESDAFLAMDRDGNGSITSGCELFGSATPQPAVEHPNGFNALRPYDSNGDSRIDSRDAAYQSLLVWVDGNHDGVSQQQELRTLSQAGVGAISLDYKELRRRDGGGNLFRYAAKFEMVFKGRTQSRWAYDVFLAGAPACTASATVTPTAVR